MNLTESKITRALCCGLERAGAFIHTMSYSRGNTSKTGAPDRWIACLGWAGWIEAKLNNAKLRTDQKVWIWQAVRRRAGCVLMVRYRLNDVQPVIVVSAIYALDSFELIERPLWQMGLWELCDGRDKPGRTPEWSAQHCQEFFGLLAKTAEACLTPTGLVC